MEKEENVSRMARFGGTTGDAGSDLDILATPLHRMFSVRVFWLVPLTLFGIITSTFGHTGGTAVTCPGAGSLHCTIVDMGGNVGSLSATLVIRAMARWAIFPPAGVTCCASSGGNCPWRRRDWW